MSQRRIHLVLGMHRGGTSATAGALHALGARAGRTLIGPSANNPAGYFEDRTVLAQMERLLAAAGSFWNDWRALDLDALDPATLAEVRAQLRDHVEAELAISPCITLKDPRNARAVGFWRDLLAGIDAEVIAVHPVRHPVAVWRSLEARNGFDLGTAARLWLRHMLDAERGSRGLRRAFIDYGELVERPDRALLRLNRTIEADWSEAAMVQAVAHLDPALQRQSVDAASIARLQTFAPEAMAAHAILLAYAVGDSPDRPRDLDWLAASFQAVTTPFAEALGRDQQAIMTLRRQNKVLSRKVQAAQINPPNIPKG